MISNFSVGSIDCHISRTIVAAIFCVSLLALTSLAIAQEPDVVVMKNGDRLTGKVKGLSRGNLSFDTDATGTIAIEWIYVDELISNLTLDVELANGQHHLGSIGVAEGENELKIDTQYGEALALPYSQVVGMTEIETTIRDRIDIDLDFGYNFTKNSDVETVNIGFDIGYTGPVNTALARFDTNQTDRGETSGVANQASLNMDYTRLLPDRWLATGILGFTSNSELGIDLRTTVGGGGGRIVSQSGGHRIAWLAGVTRVQEEIIDSPETTQSSEGFANVTIDWYPSSGPDFDLSSRWTLFPSLSTSGRYRSEFDIELEWEIFADITWSLSFYHDFDSKPLSDTAVRADYGIVTAFGLAF